MSDDGIRMTCNDFTAEFIQILAAFAIQEKIEAKGQLVERTANDWSGRFQTYIRALATLSTYKTGSA